MAKRKAPPVSKQPVYEIIEQRLRETLDTLNREPFMRALSELEYCNAVAEALDLIAGGIEMRLEELNAEQTCEEEQDEDAD